MKYASFDRETLPLITITFTGKPENEDNFSEYLDGLAANYQFKVPIALVFDASEAALPKIKYQRLQAQWMNENEGLIKNYCKGIAYVVPSLLLQRVLQFIFSIQNNPVPFKVFRNLKEAQTWALEQVS
jgi:hypothetical protein